MCSRWRNASDCDGGGRVASFTKSLHYSKAMFNGLVLDQDDMLSLIFSTGRLSPVDLVSVGRVCKQWRSVCQENARALLMAAAPSAMTKTVLMGLFAITGREADFIPRSVRRRRGGGHFYVYSDVAEEAWGVVGGVPQWAMRLRARSLHQASVERAFGPEWRRTRWLPYRTHACRRAEMGRAVCSW